MLGDTGAIIARDLWPRFPESFELNRLFKFSFLPNGLLPRLIVRILQVRRVHTFAFPPLIFTSQLGSPGTGGVILYWRTGVFMGKHTGVFNTIMVRCYEIQAELEIYVRGDFLEDISPLFSGLIGWNQIFFFICNSNMFQMR